MTRVRRLPVIPASLIELFLPRYKRQWHLGGGIIKHFGTSLAAHDEEGGLALNGGM